MNNEVRKKRVITGKEALESYEWSKKRTYRKEKIEVK